MDTLMLHIVYICLTLMVLAGIWMMSRVELAKLGNRLSAIAMLLAVIVSLWIAGQSLATILIGLCLGSAIGLALAQRVQMIQMPQLVALLNGIGGGASALVGYLYLLSRPEAGAYIDFNTGSALLAIAIGMITLMGSLVAAGKLHRILDQRGITYPGHSLGLATSALVILITIVCTYMGHYSPWLALPLSLGAVAFGWLFAIRVGGADMPITISLLNSMSGLAGAIAGLATGDIFLVAIGGIVGASGLLLTQIMCRAMNRSLVAILFGSKAVGLSTPTTAPSPTPPSTAEPTTPALETDLKRTLLSAREVIIVPGYGMALSQAQAEVYALAERFKAQGARVRYAIHPVAGRMPGHMNVLLSEANVDYDELYEMEAINEDFKHSDLVIVVGANDVLNPAARHAEGTPIYGMPVLNVDEAPQVVICNYDARPGYAGVDNPLYTRGEGIHLLLGDAKESIRSLLGHL